MIKENKTKVMLMYPNTRWANWVDRTAWDLHPYNLGILGSMLVGNPAMRTSRFKEGYPKYANGNYEVSVFDGTIDRVSEGDFQRKIKEERPDILGISVLTNEYAAAGYTAARLAKEVHPNIVNIIGGVHTTTTVEAEENGDKKIMAHSEIDYATFSEGEYVFPQLCDFISASLGSLPKEGILYRDNGKIIRTPRPPFIPDLDDLPWPNYELLDMDKYIHTSNQRRSVEKPRALPYVRVMRTRGCPYDCSFCEVHNITGKKQRVRSLEHFLGELDYLVERYDIKSLIFDDDNLTLYEDEANGLFNAMIERKEKWGRTLLWNCPAMAVFRTTEEMVDAMRESGCQYLNVAIESGDQNNLTHIVKKPLKLAQAADMIKKMKKRGIDTAANFIMGFPGETYGEIFQTFYYARKADIDYVKFFIATPCPGTELYEIAKRDGLLREDFDFDKHMWSEGQIRTKDFNPEDLGILRAYCWDQANFTDIKRRQKIIDMQGISMEELDDIRRGTRERANPTRLSKKNITLTEDTDRINNLFGILKNLNSGRLENLIEEKTDYVDVQVKGDNYLMGQNLFSANETKFFFKELKRKSEVVAANFHIDNSINSAEDAYLVADFAEEIDINHVKFTVDDNFIDKKNLRLEDLMIFQSYIADRINFGNLYKRKKIKKILGIEEKELDQERKLKRELTYHSILSKDAARDMSLPVINIDGSYEMIEH